MGDSAYTLRYAEALYELARDAGRGEAVLADLAALKRAFEGNLVEFRRLLHDRVPLREKLDVAESVFLKDRDPLVRNTILLLIKRRRHAALSRFFAVYLEVYEAREGILRISVETATPLAEDASGQIQSRIGEASGRRVVLEARTDPSILGGMRFRVGSQLVDATLKTRLERLRRKLLAAPVDVTQK